MDDVRARLTRCFSLVFPEVPHEQISRASAETVASWDSVNLVTLMAVIEEEFGASLIDADPDSLADFTSILQLLSQHLDARS